MRSSQLLLNVPSFRRDAVSSLVTMTPHGAVHNNASWAVKANRNSQPIKPLLLCEQWPVTKDSDTVPLC